MDHKQMLKIEVIEFLGHQADYDPSESLTVLCYGPAYFIVYGDDLRSDVAGFGKTPDEAFADFKVNWNRDKEPAA
jgi:hypothetical protein